MTQDQHGDDAGAQIMLTPTFLIMFYSTCFAIVVFMLFRMARKRRKQKESQDEQQWEQAATQHPVKQFRLNSDDETEQAEAATDETQPSSTEIPSAEPESAESSTKSDDSSQAESNLDSEAESALVASSLTEPASADEVVPASNDITNVSWSERELFNHQWDNREADNDVPRIAPQDIPDVDTSDYMFGSVTPMLAALMPETKKRKSQLAKDLKAAGYYKPHAEQNLAAVRYIFIMASLILFGILLVLAPPVQMNVLGIKSLESLILIGLVAFPILGWALPGLFVKNRAELRKHVIEQGMPDMLDMLNMCVSQGLTLSQSLGRIGRDLEPVYPALAQELAIVSQHAEVRSLEQALDNFSERIDVAEVKSFTQLVTQTERMGTSVSAALTEYSNNMRTNLRQRADEKANQATFRMLFPTVLCLMPAVYIFLLGPAIVELSDFFNGGRRDQLNQGINVIETLNR